MRRVDYPYGLWEVGGGSGDHLFGFYPFAKDWGTRILIRPLFELLRRIDRAWLWLNYRLNPAHQYHLINTGLEPGYYDVDTLMLNGCFALLRRYVEDERGGVDRINKFNDELYINPDPNAPEGFESGQADRQSEAVELYLWWTVERPADLKRDEELVHQLYGQGGLVKMTSKPVEGMGDGLVQIEFEEKTELAKKLRDEHWALEKKIHDDEQAMLHRLIDIRGSLWT